MLYDGCTCHSAFENDYLKVQNTFRDWDLEAIRRNVCKPVFGFMYVCTY
jgi:hypothetical protein